MSEEERPTNTCKDIPLNKACHLRDISQEIFRNLLSGGLRYKDNRIVQFDPRAKTWDVYPKYMLLQSWYMEYGHDFMPTEIENELFPAVLAWFGNSADACCYEIDGKVVFL